MKSKRVSVPDFDDILPTNKTSSALETSPQKANTSGIKSDPQSKPTSSSQDVKQADEASTFISSKSKKSYKGNSGEEKNGSSSITEIMSIFSRPKPKNKEEILITSNKTIFETMSKKAQEKKEERKPAHVETTVETSNRPEEKINIERLTETLKTIPKNDKGYASFEVGQDKAEPQQDETEQTVNPVKKLEKHLNEDDALTLVKNLKIWNKPPELALKQVADHPEFYYINRASASMKNMGNSFIVNKETGEVFIVSSAIPENLNIKKVIKQEIKPTY